MCGYFGNLHESPAVLDLMNQLGIPLPYPKGQSYPRRKSLGLIKAQVDLDGNIKHHIVDALWWYQLDLNNEKSPINEKITSFNARDLTKPLWKNAIKSRRALVFATELGESQGKDRYLMRSDTGFALGALYKEWNDETRSFAIITRPPHERFSQYHEKSLPLFIPLAKEYIESWLNPTIENDAIINEILESPKITTDLKVTKVKTYKRGEALSEASLLEKDS